LVVTTVVRERSPVLITATALIGLIGYPLLQPAWVMAN
jgi:hypothetical protein